MSIALFSQQDFDDFAERGYLVRKKAVPRAFCLALHAVAELRLKQGKFKDSRVGQGTGRQRFEEIRNDTTLWLEFEDTEASLRQWHAAIAQLAKCLNRQLFLALNAFESHFASYQPGAFYHRHIDRFKERADRQISIILYLNEHWLEGDGGQLCIYDPFEPQRVIERVLPELGSIVMFRSELFPHEVLAAQRQRLSLSGWFKTMDASEALLQGGLLTSANMT